MSEYRELGNGTFWLGDCFDVMAGAPDASVDMILCDLPYGTTACKWDTILPFEKLWAEYWRIAKPNAAVVLTASMPFTAALVMSDPVNFRYCWVWDKVNLNTGALNANKMPMKRHEDICVFYKALPIYNKQYDGTLAVKGGHVGGHAETVGNAKRGEKTESGLKNPCSVLQIKGMERGKGLHPTQKPVALFEYLIKTYSNEGDLVLDNCAGSGTTAIAAENTGRRWVCIEQEQEYADKAVARIEAHLAK